MDSSINSPLIRSNKQSVHPVELHLTGGGQRLQPFFSLGNKKSRLVSIHSESTGVTGVFEVRPVLEGSGRDADPCQRQLLGPSVITKIIGPQRTGGGQRLQPVFPIDPACAATPTSVQALVDSGSDGCRRSYMR